MASQNNTHGHGCNCICLACFASRLPVLPLLPSPSLPFPSSAQARSKTFAHRTLPRCQLFPPRVLSLAFSLSPGFHSSLSSSVRSRSAIAQVGSLLLFFVPRPVTSTLPASPRRRCLVIVPCAALVRPTVPFLFDARQVLPGENVACVRGPSLEPYLWHQADCVHNSCLAWLEHSHPYSVVNLSLTLLVWAPQSSAQPPPTSHRERYTTGQSQSTANRSHATRPTPSLFHAPWTLLRLSAPCPSRCLFRRPAALLDKPSLTYAKKDSDPTGILPVPHTKTSRTVPDRPFFTHPSTLHHDHLWL